MGGKELQPLVSIIMGVHNGEKTLEDCINSVICQSYTNWEFIICDDCSTDETYNMLLRASRKDKRIKILHNYEKS